MDDYFQMRFQCLVYLEWSEFWGHFFIFYFINVYEPVQLCIAYKLVTIEQLSIAYKRLAVEQLSVGYKLLFIGSAKVV